MSITKAMKIRRVMNFCKMSYVTITVSSLVSIMSLIELYNQVILLLWSVTKEVTCNKHHLNVCQYEYNTEKDLPPT